MNKDHIKGKWDDVKGRVKEGIGDATDDPNLRDEGTIDRAKGGMRDAWGDVKDGARDIKEDIKDIGRRKNDRDAA